MSSPLDTASSLPASHTRSHVSQDGVSQLQRSIQVATGIENLTALNKAYDLLTKRRDDASLIDPVSLQTLMDGFVRAGETLSANAGRREIPGIPLQVQPPRITRSAAGRRVDERLRSWGENIKQQVSRGKSAKKESKFQQIGVEECD